MIKQSLFRSSGRKAKSVAEAVQKKELQKDKKPTVQTKLTVGKPNDKYEQEADRVADQVISTDPGPAQALQRKCAACKGEEQVQRAPVIQRADEEEVQPKALPHIMRMPEEELQTRIQKTEEEEIQTKPEGNSRQVAPDSIQRQIENSKGGGSPLSSATRSLMESRIGADFGQVRIHNDSNAHQLSAKLNAQAFAVGNNVFFNQGKYNPESQSGKHLLAHELTHTVQQGAAVQTRIQKQDNDQDSQAEQLAGDVKYIQRILRTALAGKATSVSMTWQKNPGGIIVGYSIHGDTGKSGTSIQAALDGINGLVRIFYNSSNNEATLTFTRSNTGWLSKYVPTPLPKKKPVPKPKPKKIKRVGKSEERIAIPNYPGWVAVDGDYWMGKVRELPHFIKVESNAAGTKLIVKEGKYKGQPAAYKNPKPDKKSTGAGDRAINTDYSFIYAKPRPAVHLTVEYHENLSPRAGHILTKGILKGAQGEIKFVTETANPVPVGKHDIEIPDFQHNKTKDLTYHGSTWFRLGHSGDRYLHPGSFSKGCITIIGGYPYWEHIYGALIEARKDDKSVGTMTVIDKRNTP